MRIRGISRQIRRITKQIFSKWYRRRYNVQWNNSQRLKVLIETWSGFTATGWIKTLNNDFDGWEQFIEVHFVKNSLERYILAPEMEVYVSTWLTSDLLAQSCRLRWVHLAIAGVEFLEDMRIPPEVKVTTAVGVAADSLAEHVIGLFIMLARRLDLAVKRQRRWSWEQKGIVEKIRTLKGGKVGIVGLGHNGLAVARLARALGMRVVGLDKRRELTSEDVETVYQPSALLVLLMESDFVVLCVPLTRETRGLIGRPELEALGCSSYLINVARGEVVDEDALGWALRNGIIAGAAIDVLSIEPPPRFNSLRRCPNLIITPHMAGNIYSFRDEIRRRFVSNLKAFASGDELESLYQNV